MPDVWQLGQRERYAKDVQNFTERARMERYGGKGAEREEDWREWTVICRRDHGEIADGKSR